MSSDPMRSIQKLAKWRTVFTGWQLGTMEKSQPGVAAIRDHWEKLILLRAEVSALTGLLIRKGVFDAAEYTEALGQEAELLSAERDRWRRGADRAAGRRGKHHRLRRRQGAAAGETGGAAMTAHTYRLDLSPDGQIAHFHGVDLSNGRKPIEVWHREGDYIVFKVPAGKSWVSRGNQQSVPARFKFCRIIHYFPHNREEQLEVEQLFEMPVSRHGRDAERENRPAGRSLWSRS